MTSPDELDLVEQQSARPYVELGLAHNRALDELISRAEAVVAVPVMPVAAVMTVLVIVVVVAGAVLVVVVVIVVAGAVLVVVVVVAASGPGVGTVLEGGVSVLIVCSLTAAADPCVVVDRAGDGVAAEQVDGQLARVGVIALDRAGAFVAVLGR